MLPITSVYNYTKSENIRTKKKHFNFNENNIFKHSIAFTELMTIFLFPSVTLLGWFVKARMALR